MRVWLLQTSETLPLTPDSRRLRTALLAEQLNFRGHHVVWWASAFNHLRKRWVFDEDTQINVRPDLEIRALKGIGYRKNVSLKRFVDHRILAKKFKAQAAKLPKPDVIVTSMPSHDSAYEAVCYAERNQIPVLVDVRDQWPDNFLDHVPSALRPFGYALLANEFRMVKHLLRKANGIISMSDALFNWGLTYAKRDKASADGVFHLGYAPVSIPAGYQSAKIDEIQQRVAGGFVVTFIGTFANYHDPSLLVDAARALKDYNIKFVLAGDGELFEAVKKHAFGLDNVFFPGWLEQHDISLLLRISHVGTCPTGQVGSDRAFFPNKVFSYLAEGLPILSAFGGELQDVLDTHETGYTYRDINDLVRFIQQLSSDQGRYQKLSTNARNLFTEQYNAVQIYSNYAIHIENVVRDSSDRLQNRKLD